MRALMYLLVAVVIAAGGYSAFWFTQKASVEDQVTLALQDLERAGVETSYESFEVGGFPFAYEGAFTTFVAKIPGRNVSIALPNVSARVELASADTVEFGLPDTFKVDVLDAGGAVIQTINVTSSNLASRVTVVGESGLDMALSADSLEMTPEGSSETVTLAKPALDGKLSIAPDGSDASVDAHLVMETATLTFQPGGAPTPSTATIAGLDTRIDGALDGVVANIAAARLSVDGGDEAQMEFADLVVKAEATPDGAFSAEPLAGAKSFEDAIGGFILAALDSMASNGAVKTSLNVGTAEFSSGDGDPSANGVLTNFAYEVEVGPKRMGVGVTAAALDVTVKGAQGGVYKTNGLEFVVAADAAEAFALNRLLGASESEAAFVFLEIIRDEIVKGGKVELRAKTESGESDTAMPPGLPFERLIAKSGASNSLIEVTQTAAKLESTATKVFYETKGPIAGSGELASFTMRADAPLQKADAPQDATVLVELGEITLSDSLWALLDPGTALTDRSIKGLKLDATVALRVLEDVLTASLAAPAPPAAPESGVLRDSFFELFGLRADLSGEGAMTPAPTGRLRVLLTNWSRFVDEAPNTALGQDPAAVSSILQADGFIRAFGVPGEAPNTTLLDVELGAQGVAINGKPLTPPAPPPGPAPEPAPEAEPAPQ